VGEGSNQDGPYAQRLVPKMGSEEHSPRGKNGSSQRLVPKIGPKEAFKSGRRREDDVVCAPGAHLVCNTLDSAPIRAANCSCCMQLTGSFCCDKISHVNIVNKDTLKYCS
jgi:hypothetical protein